jgi:hypothetical protein
MSETNTVNTNGKHAINSDNHRVKAQKKQRFLQSLPTASAASEMGSTGYQALVDKTPVEFGALDNYEMFSMSPDGSFPMLRVSKSKAIRLADRKVFQTGGGRVYRISISNFSAQSSG